MEYTIWAVPALCEDPIEITVHSNGDGRKATQECLSAAATVWEGVAAAGAVMMNAHPTTGQTADELGLSGVNTGNRAAYRNMPDAFKTMRPA